MVQQDGFAETLMTAYKYELVYKSVRPILDEADDQIGYLL